jgi:hypothetical protein
MKKILKILILSILILIYSCQQQNINDNSGGDNGDNGEEWGAEFVSINPHHGALGISIYTNIEVTFDRYMDSQKAGTVVLDKITFSDGINCDMEISDSYVTVDPYDAFNYNTAYTGINISDFKGEDGLKNKEYRDSKYSVKTQVPDRLISWHWERYNNSVFDTDGSELYNCGKSGFIGEPTGSSGNENFFEGLAYTCLEDEYFHFSFNGKETGTYTNDDAAFRWVLDQGADYASSDNGPINTTLTVTKYEDVGGFIVGTFSGTVYLNSEPTVRYEISNGEFILRHTAEIFW